MRSKVAITAEIIEEIITCVGYFFKKALTPGDGSLALLQWVADPLVLRQLAAKASDRRFSLDDLCLPETCLAGWLSCARRASHTQMDGPVTNEEVNWLGLVTWIPPGPG